MHHTVYIMILTGMSLTGKWFFVHPMSCLWYRSNNHCLHKNQMVYHVTQPLMNTAVPFRLDVKLHHGWITGSGTINIIWTLFQTDHLFFYVYIFPSFFFLFFLVYFLLPVLLSLATFKASFSHQLIFSAFSSLLIISHVLTSCKFCTAFSWIKTN